MFTYNRLSKNMAEILSMLNAEIQLYIEIFSVEKKYWFLFLFLVGMVNVLKFLYTKAPNKMACAHSADLDQTAPAPAGAV